MGIARRPELIRLAHHLADAKSLARPILGRPEQLSA
jgi:hypothetical protein